MKRKIGILLVFVMFSTLPVFSFLSSGSAFAAVKNQTSITSSSAIVQSVKTKDQVVMLTRELSKDEQKTLEQQFNFKIIRKGSKGKSILVTPTDDAKFADFLKNDFVAKAYNNQTYKLDAQTVDWGNTYVGGTLARRNSTPIIGNKMVVAVVDSGVQLNHPDIASAIKAGGYDYINDDTDPSDDNGHGTHVAGIIAAQNNTTGTLGIAYGAKILPFKVCNASGLCDALAIADAINDAVDQQVDVINISLGGSANELIQTAINRATTAGIIVVAASGNEGTAGCDYPAMYSNVVCVGAIDSAETHPSYSNYGTGLDVVAPGSSVQSLWLSSGMATASGTSMSTAYYSGVAAVIRSIQEDICTANPSASQCSDIRGYTLFLINNFLIRDLGDYGYDSQFGAGAVDMSRLFLNTGIVYSNLPANVNQGVNYLQTIQMTNSNSFNMSLKSCKVRGDNTSLVQTQPFWTTGWLVLASNAAYAKTSSDLFEARYSMVSSPYTILAGATLRFDYSVNPATFNRNGDKIDYYFTCNFDDLSTTEVENYAITPVLNSTTVQQPDPLDAVYYRFATLQENQTVPASQLNTYDTLTLYNFNATTMRIVGIYTLDYDTNTLSGATNTKLSNTQYRVKASYNLPAGHHFAYVVTIDNTQTGRRAYKFFNFNIAN